MNNLKPSNSELIVYKFKSLTLVENRIIIINQKKEKFSILFTELEKIYIKNAN